ncbi:hypothetical protein SprV_0301294800 [Sparganum proliferum]
MKPTSPPPPKLNTKLVNLNCPRLTVPTPNRPRPAHDGNRPSRHQSVSLDFFKPTSAPERHHLLSPVHLCLVPPAPTINNDGIPEPALPSSSIVSISAATAPAPIATALNPNKPTNINLTTATTSDVDSVHTCPYCDRTFTSRIGFAVGPVLCVCMERPTGGLSVRLQWLFLNVAFMAPHSVGSEPGVTERLGAASAAPAPFAVD